MSRALAYCAFQYAEQISLPSTGVQGVQVQVMSLGDLRLLWSQVEWPFAADQVQKHAVEFHAVVDHVFRQAAVVPFRLLSVFDDETAMKLFATENQSQFLADLDRLKDFVQMECVIYPAPDHAPPTAQAGTSTGKAYLEQKAGMRRAITQHLEAVKNSLNGVGHQVSVREGKNGHRVFVLVQRGRESTFRERISATEVPQGLSRRLSGPWPAAEFLSEAVKSPTEAK